MVDGLCSSRSRSAWGDKWILVLGCGVIYFVVNLMTKPPSDKTINLLFPAKK
jgi:hypothetical protein